MNYYIRIAKMSYINASISQNVRHPYHDSSESLNYYSIVHSEIDSRHIRIFFLYFFIENFFLAISVDIDTY